ncbi:hypothetical protein KQI63_15720 [bacterium]|nr:hypothetical protein [bacterium]
MKYPTKRELLALGVDILQRFCAANDLKPPSIEPVDRAGWPFNHCGYYRLDVIVICPEKCAHVGSAGRAWSYPGYTVDRTPYGVLQHELGHHADVLLSSRVAGGFRGDFSEQIRALSSEEPLTGYCPNSAEWFAEMFRLFVTNPDLLHLIRPRTWNLLREYFVQAHSKSWQTVLADAPSRTVEAARRKIDAAQRRAA